jgi:hypothetical protein
MPKQRFGGSFAPPLTDEKLAAYKQFADAAADPQIRDAMLVLHNCAAQWWEQPESTGDGRPHPSGRGVIVDLDQPIAAALFDHIPWKDELDVFAARFDGIDAVASKELRDAAFHLLWFARELDLDREPLTANKL